MKYTELSDKAKEHVHVLLEPDHGWWEDIYEHAKEDGEAKGFRIERIYFSGFYSQGDGACWEGHIIWDKYLKRKWEETGEIEYGIAYALKDHGFDHTRVRSRGDSHTYLPDGLCWYEEEGLVNAPDTAFHEAEALTLWQVLRDKNWIEYLEQELTKDIQEYAEEIYKNLEEEYEHQTSDAYIADLCEINEYEFNEEGEWA